MKVDGRMARAILPPPSKDAAARKRGTSKIPALSDREAI
jgi:hypothetical protein